MVFVCLFPYNPCSINWLDVFWGQPEKDLLGRGAMACLVALREKADKLLFGGGLRLLTGEAVAQVKHNFLMEHIGQLASLEEAQGFVLGQLSEIVVIDNNPTNNNTAKIAQWHRSVFNQEDLGHSRNRVIVVADYNHGPRAFNDTMAVFGDLLPRVRVELVCSDVPYDGEPGDCIIFEPPLIEAMGGREEVMGLVVHNKHKAGKAKVGQAGW